MGAVGSAPPPSHVITAFGASNSPERLTGGQGTSWRLGRIVLKPIDMDEEELEWQADLLPSLRTEGFRVSCPQRTGDGLLVVDGWCAWDYVAGLHQDRRWADIIRAGEAFHAALADVPRPGFLDRRTDPWAMEIAPPGAICQSRTSSGSNTFAGSPARSSVSMQKAG